MKYVTYPRERRVIVTKEVTTSANQTDPEPKQASEEDAVSMDTRERERGQKRTLISDNEENKI